MASNSFGQYFRMTTWGESHGPAVGVVVDGCPAGLPITTAIIQTALDRRAPGRLDTTSERRESDQVEILSGVHMGQTTGAPISLMIRNRDAKSEHYEALKHKLRPGHANFTYLRKYGVFDHRGGGRASARETACRVAAGAIAEVLLAHHGVSVSAYLQSMANIACAYPFEAVAGTNHCLHELIDTSPVYCPDADISARMAESLAQAREDGDSLGGIVSFQVQGTPVGWGDPIYEKLEAQLAHAMLSIPASKGFEIGEGFAASTMRGSEHNDSFLPSEKGSDPVTTETNHAGGTLGGISNGQLIYGRVAFKPTSSIKSVQPTTDLQGQACTITLPTGSRHDPCVAIRAVPVVRAMAALVVANACLADRLSRLSLEDRTHDGSNPTT